MGEVSEEEAATWLHCRQGLSDGARHASTCECACRVTLGKGERDKGRKEIVKELEESTSGDRCFASGIWIRVCQAAVDGNVKAERQSGTCA